MHGEDKYFMRVVLGCDVLDHGVSGMRFALEGFLNEVVEKGIFETFSLLHSKPFPPDYLNKFREIVIQRRWGFGGGLMWSELTVPKNKEIATHDIVHWTNQILPPVYIKIPLVVSVWDLAHLNFREGREGAFSAQVKYGLILRAALSKAARIICHSEYIAQEVAERFRIKDSKIEVIYPALNQSFKSEIRCDYVPDDSGYILYVGTSQVRKNVSLLIDAYLLLVKRGVKNKLFLKCSFSPSEILGLKEKLSLSGIPPDRVVIKQKVSSLELNDIYRSSAVLAFPSLYEGFGLPLLEAMAFGLPIVALNRGAMKEVVSDAGILVGTPNPHEFAEALYQLLQSSSDMALCSARSKQRADMFRWDVAVDKTMSVYSSL